MKWYRALTVALFLAGAVTLASCDSVESTNPEGVAGAVVENSDAQVSSNSSALQACGPVAIVDIVPTGPLGLVKLKFGVIENVPVYEFGSSSGEEHNEDKGYNDAMASVDPPVEGAAGDYIIIRRRIISTFVGGWSIIATIDKSNVDYTDRWFLVGTSTSPYTAEYDVYGANICSSLTAGQEDDEVPVWPRQ